MPTSTDAVDADKPTKTTDGCSANDPEKLSSVEMAIEKKYGIRLRGRVLPPAPPKPTASEKPKCMNVKWRVAMSSIPHLLEDDEGELAWKWHYYMHKTTDERRWTPPPELDESDLLEMLDGKLADDPEVIDVEAPRRQVSVESWLVRPPPSDNFALELLNESSR